MLDERLKEEIDKIIRDTSECFSCDDFDHDGRYCFTRDIGRSVDCKRTAQISALVVAKVEEAKNQIFEVGDKVLEIALHGDYSNGNEFFGVDEGRVRAYEVLNELDKDWQSLKQGKEEV